VPSQPLSPWARLQAWERLTLRLSLALHCSLTSLEALPLSRLRWLATELEKK
jgi:hypothetical protein